MALIAGEYVLLTPQRHRGGGRIVDGKQHVDGRVDGRLIFVEVPPTVRTPEGAGQRRSGAAPHTQDFVTPNVEHES